MQRQTVDYGIDLGTTNSAICRMERSGPKIIKNRYQNDTTPSAVARTSDGQTKVGMDALNKADLNPSLRFKRLMGTAHGQTLKDNSIMMPEELSAEILKELKSAVQLRYAEAPEYVVITVPAMFQQPQCEATLKAAEIAGLQAVSLLQEPIAAATAYIHACPEDGYYIVYDLGGGTFDVSIICVKNNEMNVITHGGDNYLGGSDFDREIYDWVLSRFISQCGKHPNLTTSDKYRLLQECERAKIELSFKDKATLDFGDMHLPLDSMVLDRQILEDLVAKHVSRTVLITRERVSEAHLDIQDINSILLVGGPTMMPFVRRHLQDELGVRLSLDQDPMTVVACGAAIHAGTLLKPTQHRITTSQESSVAKLELHYEPVSPDLECSISGRVVHPLGFSGEIMISRTGGDWESGWIKMQNGAFVCTLLLRESAICDFHFLIRDKNGITIKSDPELVSIRHGVATAKPVASYNYGVALEGGTFGPVLECGMPRPSYNLVTFSASKTLLPGSSDCLEIYFLEGNSSEANDNVNVGEIKIQGSGLKRTLKEGEKIEIRISLDENNKAKARVSVPLHDLDYETELKSLIQEPDKTDLKVSFREFKDMLIEV